MVLAAYIALSITGTLAAAKASGWLRWWIAYDVLMALVFKLATVLIHNHRIAMQVYKLGWMIGEPIGVALVAGAVLQVAPLRRVPYFAAPALAVQWWAFSFPDRWPGQWLQFEMHTIAFCYLLLGLSLIPAIKSLTAAALSAFLLGTAAMYYPAPWAPFVREWLMWWQSGCYLAMAGASFRREGVA